MRARFTHDMNTFSTESVNNLLIYDNGSTVVFFFFFFKIEESDSDFQIQTHGRSGLWSDQAIDAILT